MPGNYFTVVLAAKRWLGFNPGASRTQLRRWMMGTFHLKSRRTGTYIDNMVRDDFIRVVVDVETKGKREGKGRNKTRYIATPD